MSAKILLVGILVVAATAVQAGSIIREGCEIQNCKVLCFNKTITTSDCQKSISYTGKYESYNAIVGPSYQYGVIAEYMGDSTCNSTTPSAFTTLPCELSNPGACPLGVSFTKCTTKSITVSSECDTTSSSCGSCGFTTTLHKDGGCEIVRRDAQGNAVYGKLQSIGVTYASIRQGLYSSAEDCSNSGNTWSAIVHIPNECNRGVEFFN